jgi:hypothetical protein
LIGNRCFRELHLIGDIAAIFQNWPRNSRSSAAKGIRMADYPADLHLRLCVINGDVLLRDKLAALLAS